MRIYHLHKRHSPREVRTKVAMPVAILRLRTPPNTIRQNRLQPVVIRPRHIEPFVRDNPRKVLSNTLPHHARFAMMHSKPLLKQNPSRMKREALNATLKIRAA